MNVVTDSRPVPGTAGPRRGAVPSVLLFNHDLRPIGGGEAVTVWAIEALKSVSHLTVVTWRPPDLDLLNRFYGTALGPGEFRVLTPPAPFRAAFDALLDRLDADPYSLQRWGVLVRWIRRIAGQYDAVLTMSNEADFGERCLAYMHYPYLETTYRRLKAAAGTTWPARMKRKLVYEWRPWGLVSGFSFDRLRTSRLLSNSDWTAAKIRSVYGMGSSTVYPPVRMAGETTPWAERAPDFVCIGRAVPEKRQDWVIATLEVLRGRGWRGRLHLVVPGGAGAGTHARIRALAAERRDWVEWHEGIEHTVLCELLSRSRYGIHAMKDEHFGIAVAEMAGAGCLVFAPASGGPVEILGGIEELLYEDDDAVCRIEAVLSDPGLQERLRARLADHVHLFSVETFMRRIREEVFRTVASGGGRAP